MKTVPPTCPEPQTGPQYWRSLDQLADTPEFREWLEKEFPHGAAELADAPNRRQFVKIMSASFLLAGLGLTGCRRPEEKIMPFGRAVPGYVHGVPQYYATAMPARRSAIPLVVRSHDGRPTKIEGNPQHPASNGSTDQFAQASILNLYDPDRATQFKKDGKRASREDVATGLGELAAAARANGGTGLAFLLERGGSPSRDRVIAEVKKALPNARWFVHEPVDFDIHREAATLAFGKPVAPVFHYDKAKVIVSLDCDFIGGEEETYINVRRYAQGRRVTGPNSSMSRLYAVEALFTLTGANADHRLRVAPSAVLNVAAQLAAKVLGRGQTASLVSSLGSLTGAKVADEKWISECANDLLDEHHHGNVLVVAGHRQPLAVHLLAHAMNVALGAVGKTVTFQTLEADGFGKIQDLAAQLDSGSVETLVLVGGNPAYTAPADVNWAQAAAKAKNTVRLGYYEDESFNAKGWHLPQAHFLESWGDARTADGTLVPVQPLIAPLFDAMTELELLARIGGLAKTNPHDIVRETFNGLAGSEENAWRKFLHDGFLAGSAAPAVNATFDTAAVARVLGAAQAAPSAAGSLEVVFHRSYAMDDGRFNNNGWLQETPDPITKLVWDNAVLVSPATAEKLGLGKLGSSKTRDTYKDATGGSNMTPEAKKGQFHNQVVKVTVGGRSVTGPVWIVPGMADNVAGLALGYGREKTGRVGTAQKGGPVGFNAYKLRTSQHPHFAGGATISATGQTHQLASTQEHGVMEGRPIVREANLEQYRKHPDFAKNMDLDSPGHTAHIDMDPAKPGLPKRIYKAPPLTGLHQWGMTIDLTACVGCTACQVACQSENNIPIVGHEQVTKGREMSWMRLDRYFAGDVNNPQVAFQPMLCQHCENAPCESVCPVNATVHDEEGLNLMAYNRCVGTRYCSNNCPYKVRRFNYFDYNRRPLSDLYKSAIDPRNETNGQWEFWRWFKDPSTGSKPKDEWDLMHLAKNPNVSVRMRGVMEKCTFCLQRIEEAKIAQKVKAGPSDDVRVPDGAIKTACQQACPAEAIVFGDISDPDSRVSQMKKLERNYTVLGYLDTRTRNTYLARIRNPNPKMPDYLETTAVQDEYYRKSGSSPFEPHGGHGPAKASAAADHGKGGH